MQALIGSIYDAASEPRLWTDVVQRIVRRTNARSGIFYEHDDTTKQSRVFGAEGFDPHYLQAYERYYGALDPWHKSGLSWPVGSVAQTAALLPDRELKRSEFYNDHLRPQRVFYALGAPIERSRGSMAVFGVQGGYENGNFTQEIVALVIALVPHFRRAYGIQRALGDIRREGTELESALHALVQPVLIVDRDARLWFANSAGAQLLGRADLLRLSGKRLHTAHRRDAAAFAQALAPVPRGSDGDGTLSLRRAGNAAPCIVRIAPLRHENRAEWTGRIAVLVELPPAPRGLAASAAAFRLSAAEFRLWEELVAGRTVAEIAERSGLSVNTVRVHLAALFRKTGTHRQADLIRLGLDLMDQ
jgi:DNA-binding CsgD family transcriptional regulator